MRIAFIAPFGLQPKGTVSSRMLPLAQALARRGHTVRVVIPPWDDPAAQRNVGARFIAPFPSPLQSPSSLRHPQAKDQDSVQIGSVEVVTLPMPMLAPNTLALPYGLVRWALSTPSRAGAQHDAPPQPFRAHVAHVFKPVGYSGLAGLALHVLGVPWALDTDDWEGPGGWADVNPYSPAQKLALVLMESLLPRMAGSVTAASRALEARAWGFGIRRRRVFYLPNGVSEEKYGAWSHSDGNVGAGYIVPTHEDGPTILLYTRFAEFPYWWPLHVLRSVREHHPTARMLVVGSGFFGEEEKLRERAESMGVGEHIIATGRVPEADLPSLLRLGDVALYPMADNLINRAKSPVKLIEPMVAGLPIVAHRVGQTTEFLGDAGILVPSGDLRGMAAGVSALLSDPARRLALGERARQRVWSELNWERLSGMAERAYGVALNRVSGK